MADECDLVRAAYPQFSKEEVDAVLEEIARMKEAPDYSIAFQKKMENDYNLAREVALNEVRHVKKVREISKALRPKIQRMLQDKDAFSSRITDMGRLRGANTPFMELLVGGDKAAKGTRVSAKAIENSITSELNTVLFRKLEKSGQLDTLMSGRFDLEAARYQDAKLRGEDLSKFSPQAKMLSDTLDDVNRRVRIIAYEQGYPMGVIDDYFARQIHNNERIASATPEEWLNYISERINRVEMFPQGISDEDFVKTLMDIREGILVDSDQAYRPGNFGGKRRIKFKSNEAAMEYNAMFGHGTLLGNANASNRSFSRSVGRYSIFGPKPDKMREIIDKEVMKALDDEGKRLYMDDSLFGAKTTRDAVWKESYGYERNPNKASISNITRSITLIQSAARLGSSIFTTIADIPNTFMQYKVSTGKGSVGEAFTMLKDFNKMFFSNKKLREVQSVLQLETRTELGDVYSRLGVGEAPGVGEHGSYLLRKLDSFNRKVVDATLLPRQTEVGRADSALMYAKNIAEESGKDFDSLNPRFKAGLEAFNIDKNDWKVVKNFLTEVEGVKLIDIDKMYNTDSVRKIGRKFNMYLIDGAHTAIQESTALERGGLITRGLNPEDIEGSAVRLMGIFKSFTLARTRTFRRIVLANPEIEGNSIYSAMKEGQYQDLGYLAQMIVYSSILEGVATIIKKEAQGEAVEIDNNFMIQNIQKAGAPLATNYIIDVAKGEYNKWGYSVFKDMAGPALSQIPDVVKILGGFKPAIESYFDGDLDYKSPNTIRFTNFIVHNLPGNNLPIVPAVLDATVMQAFYEYVDPVYARKKEMRNARKKDGYLYNALNMYLGE